MHTLIIFLRHPNDIDHLTPVIWKWLQVDDHHVTAVFPWGAPIPKTDFRIALLCRLDRFRMIEIQASDSVDWPEIKIQDFIANLLPDSGKICIAFDWLHQKMHKEIFWAQSLVAFTRERKIPMVCLPHGDHCHTGNMLRVNEIGPEATSLYYPVGIFDTLVVPNQHCGFRYQEFLPSERIQVLGSPRYNSEWLDVLDEIAPDFIIPEAKNKNKVALFLRHGGYPIFWEEVLWTVKLISQFENNYLVVIPHTRGEVWKSLVDCYPELGQNKSNYTCIEEEGYAGSIVKWADVVIDIGTSVVFESVMRGKNIICAEYLHATRSIISKYIPDSVVLCRDELYAKLTNVNRDPSIIFYSAVEAESFIHSMVHVPDEHVLDRYVGLLSTAETKKNDFIGLRSSDNVNADPSRYNFVPLVRRHSEIEKLLIECEKANKFYYKLYEDALLSMIVESWNKIKREKQINEVLLLLSATQAVRILPVLMNADGPGIIGLLSMGNIHPNKCQNLTLIDPGSAHDLKADAIVFVSCSSLKTETALTDFRSHNLNQPLIDLCENIPGVREVESQYIDYYRCKRDFFMKYGDIDKALAASQMLLGMYPNDSDFERHYWLGLKMDKMGNSNKSSLIYQQIANDRRVKPELIAWALFKKGELFYHQNDVQSANRYFSLALKYNPEHAKAAIYLNSDNSLLSVALGEDEKLSNSINVAMDPMDTELWEYYFSRRKPDYIQFDMDANSDSYRWALISDMLSKYLAPDGTASIQLKSTPDDIENIVSKFNRRDRLNAKHLDNAILLIKYV